ncbi:succinyl-diaminopimelate desuccinylase [Parvularcula dongshanensis]|uniref:Succinyl-diaminopimelate desuccinylase n=1 Tax=Parvularcula dongshanensis TaxID=1173995 RepID=A0A840I1Z3_9PROT|nr:succinyl-diaminopimelate desuccinylase [Parvularcula dongshanensis]MBB4658303.1 succinyl-diaminopimelate desuccinylase [Parvularcula dongshanensis]
MTDLTDPVALASDLIRCPSVTPIEGGALDLLQFWAEQLGFRCTRLSFGEGATSVDNLWAVRGEGGPRFCFAGHTDVVPPGDMDAWQSGPFDPVIADGRLHGRGAADMKGGIAAMVAAVARAGERTPPLAFLITGDEEGQAIHGTKAVLGAVEARGEGFEHCLVGEPTNPDRIGSMMKVGRRGSCNAILTVHGRQGHVAYPDRAENPLPVLQRILTALTDVPLDDGYDRFQPSNLELTGWGTPEGAENVIPASAWTRFNVRFNPNWTGETLVRELERRIATAAGPTQWHLAPRVSGEAFLTEDDRFARLVADAVEAETKVRPELSTSGGTSDARFLSRHAPTIEFGLVGATMHQVNENVAVEDLEALTCIYGRILAGYAAW